MKLNIPSEIHDKIMRWMNKANKEVSGFGNLEYDPKTQVFTVTDVFLLKQTVSASSTEIDADAIGKMMYLTRENALGMKWHWHSHVNMGVFWSGDDRALIKDMAEQGWILATVFNLKGEKKTAFSMYPEFEGMKMEVFKDDIPTTIVNLYPQETLDAWDQEYKDCVSEQVYVTKTWEKWESKRGANSYKGASGYDYDHYGYNDHGYGGYDSGWGGLSKSKPKKKQLLERDFDLGGYANSEEGWVYNPLCDNDAETLQERIEAFAFMTDKELETLLELNQEASEFVKRYRKEIDDVKILNEATGLNTFIGP